MVFAITDEIITGPALQPSQVTPSNTKGGSERSAQEPQSPLDLKSPMAFENTDAEMPDVGKSAPKSDQDGDDEGNDGSKDGSDEEDGADDASEGTKDNNDEVQDEDDQGSVHDEEDEEGDNVSNTGSNSTAQWSHEPFETYQHKVAQLCQDLGYGEPKEIERMTGGSYNRITGLHVPSNPVSELILRVPRMLDDDQANDLKDQVAVLLFLSPQDSLHVPKVVSYDATTDNCISNMFVVQERIQGSAIADVFYELPLAEKLQIVGIVAELLIKLEDVAFDKPGRLTGSQDIPSKSVGPPPELKDITISGFRFNPIEDFPSSDAQPLVDFLTSLIDYRLSKVGDWEECEERWKRLKDIVKEMESADLIRTNDTKNVLWHWDLSANNILINREGADAGRKTESNTAITEEPTVSKHTVQIKVEDPDSHGTVHSVQIQVEDKSGKKNSHKLEVTIEDNSGKKYRHAVQITTGEESETEKLKQAPTDTPGKWDITGVLDWDDVRSVPQILARKPPSWLWLNEDNRPSDWDGDRDSPAERDLTGDELLIKAQFDQIMERARPGYIQDTYCRGVWLRRLAKIALAGFSNSTDWKAYPGFVEQWDEYYAALQK
ncbi:hypothetical protein B0J14DRAFT_598897 [Halenospora varia]|nr:hypothetical protein B0J14DRAFT_598897 [Halenospora varia]